MGVYTIILASKCSIAKQGLSTEGLRVNLYVSSADYVWVGNFKF